MSEKPRTIVCLVVDGLSAGMLGPYGNTWIDTPGFNQLAAESLVLDFATIDSPDLEQLCISFWTGEHAAEASDDSVNELAAFCQQAGLRTELFTDDATVAQHALAEAFDSVTQLPEGETRQADDIERTNAAHFFAEALEQLRRAEAPTLFWLHSSGMRGPWDAPQALREQLADEEDPDPLGDAAVPAMFLEVGFDPDVLLPVVQGYAAQVMAYDACLAAFCEEFRAAVGEDAVLIVLGARGFPLGEHRRVGDAASPAVLYEELVHIPWFVDDPAETSDGMRSAALVQSPDLPGMIAAALGQQDAWPRSSLTVAELLAAPSRTEEDESAVMTVAPASGEAAIGEASLRTSHWYLRMPTDNPAAVELFVKPDDRLEVNNIADRCAEIVEEMSLALGSQLTQQGDSE